jgi:hypothetical protein
LFSPRSTTNSTRRAPEGVEVIYSGVGKVNAASAATLSQRERGLKG